MGKVSLESVWNENSNELRTKPWLTAGFSELGRGSVSTRERRNGYRGCQKTGSGLSRSQRIKSFRRFFEVRHLKHIFKAYRACDYQASLDYAVETTPKTQA